MVGDLWDFVNREKNEGSRREMLSHPNQDRLLWGSFTRGSLGNGVELGEAKGVMICTSIVQSMGRELSLG